MSKISDFINSKSADDDAPYKVNLAISINMFVLIFFILSPIVIGTMERSFNLLPKTNSTLINTILFILFYPLSIAVAVLAVKWQKKKLAIKSLKFKKIYLLVVVSISSLLILLRIVLSLLSRNV